MQEVQKYLSKFAKNVIKESRSRLSKSSKRDTNNLYGSLGYQLDVFKNSFSLSFFMEEYGAFVDEGVQGKRSSAKAPQSPFRFGTGSGRKGGLTEAISKWIERKGIQGRDKQGRFISNKSLTTLISRSIYNKGIAPSMFFTKPFENAFKNLPDEIIEKFNLDIDELIESSLNT